MAISAVHYQLLKELHAAGKLPQGGSLLQLGEPEWYGDMSTAEIDGLRDGMTSHEIAAQVYRNLCSPSRVVSIDLHGTPAAHTLDLNAPVWLEGGQFDLCVNHGTLEHIFDVAQVFRTIHDWTKPGGLMLHEAPFTGWVDHGFYCLQPTLFYDIGAANDYTIELFAVCHLPTRLIWRPASQENLLQLVKVGGVLNNSMLFVALRKTTAAEFRVPMQGVYSDRATAGQIAAWKGLR